MEIMLHLGAHKTATTFLQSYWQACNPIAAEAGAYTPSLGEVRRRLTPAAQTEPHTRQPVVSQDAREFLGQLAYRWRRVVISDENILGTGFGNFSTATLYGGAFARVAAVAKLMQGHSITLLFSVRSYASYLPSSYCEVLRHRKFSPFRTMLGRLDVRQRGWQHVVEDLARACPNTRILVWRYEDLAAVQTALTVSLLGVRPVSLPPPPEGKPRQSYSQQAVAVATAVYESSDAEAASKALAETALRVPAAGQEKFNPWSTEERKALDEAYANSLHRLAAVDCVEMIC